MKNWQSLAQKPQVAGAVSGVNAAVVGLLVSALYQPVFTSAVNAPLDVALILAGFFLLKQLKLPIIWMVIAFIVAGFLSGLMS